MFRRLAVLTLGCLAFLLTAAAPTLAPGAVVGLAGTPHLWIADKRGVLHWGGDTRALASKHVNWSDRRAVSLATLQTYPIGDPWLSAGLLKDGAPIYQVKWETEWPVPQLWHIQSIRDVELFGIDGSNYGDYVLDKAVWEQRYGIDADTLHRQPLASAVPPGTTLTINRVAGGGGSSALAPTPRPAPAVTITLPPLGEPAPNRPAYDRSEWRHWTDADGDCQNARHEVLLAESTAPVTYRTGRQCQVVTGQWVALYTGGTVTSAGSLDVDHLVPLKHAHDAGGWQWDAARKRAYANDLRHADHLIAVTASANRAKGARGPAEWKPSNQASWCRYARSWITVKLNWGLTSTAAEHTALREMLGTCPAGSSHVAPPAMPTVVPTAVPPPTATPRPRPTAIPRRTYRNCTELRRDYPNGVQRGHPAYQSRMDRDNDGWACER